MTKHLYVITDPIPDPPPWLITCGLIVLLIIALTWSHHVESRELLSDSEWSGIVLQHEYGVDESDAITLSQVITEASKEYSIPVEVVISIIAAESDFDPDAVSVCNAIGLMQVRPEIWHSTSPHNLYHRYDNVLAGVWILREYRKELGTLQAAIKAYNIGITNYKKGVAKSAANRYYAKVRRHYEAIKKYPKIIDTE
jgi:soluble lytic murein transglycosylase-like protein